nr:hypothetical protein [uncultured Oscillibacter sp.]
MKGIEKRVKAIGSLVGMNQAVRLISNLGGVVIGVGTLEVTFLDGADCKTINFNELANGWIVMA